ncbi:MAG: hypothetical protein Q8O79_06885 [Pseudomonadota bacterium]|nr:hypothetical protein [Pseudomonadota bacterium]
MSALTDKLKKVDALTLRERAILFILLLAGIWAVVDTLLLSPQEYARKEEREKITQASAKLVEAEQALTLRAGQPDPDQAARLRLERAQQALNARQQTAASLQARLVAPKDMVRVLQGMSADQPGLRLVSLNTLAPEAVGQSAKEPDKVQAAPTTPLFKHGVKLTLVGNYAALTQYMEKLERLPVGFYWARAELDASAHPDISLTLTLYTLSLERTWLTV